jgi:hypothetical protein
MDPISAEVIENTRQQIAEYTLDQGEQLAKRFAEEQPAVMNYLMTVDDEMLDQDERELLFYIGAVVWQTMAQGEGQLPMISDEAVQAAVQANQKMLEPIAGLTDADAAIVVQTLVLHYGQPEVLKYVIKSLMEAVSNEEVRPDNVGTIMINLKTVIDCFNASQGLTSQV